MTEAEYRELSDKEKSELVAINVMGWRSMGNKWAKGPKHEDRVHTKDWSPSADIAAAWEIVDEIRKPGHSALSLHTVYLASEKRNEWICYIEKTT